MNADEARMVAMMIEVMAEAGYMDWSKKAADLRRVKAQELTGRGLDHMMLAVLWRQAQREASRNASGLFACWMNERKRLDAAVDRLRQRNAFANQAVKEVNREGRRKREDEMRDNIRKLTDYRRNA